MPPKKKSRVPHKPGDQSTADNPGTPQAVAKAAQAQAAKGKTVDRLASDEPVLSDGWTDEQETTLFKAISIYRWKPAGMHKHFRMISITNLMANHGVMDTHTRPPGIWQKLGTLYDMKLMDEREDMDDQVLEGKEPKWTEFALPEEYKGMMTMRMERKNMVTSRDARMEKRAKPGLSSGGEDNNQEEKAPEVGKVGNEEKKPGGGDNEEESEEELSEEEEANADEEKEIVQRTKNLEVTESIAPPHGRRSKRLDGAVGVPTTPLIGNSAPSTRGIGGTPHGSARARARGGRWGRSRNSTNTEVTSDSLSEPPDSREEDTGAGETTNEEESDSHKGRGKDNQLVVPTTPQQGWGGGRGRGRGRGGLSSAAAAMEPDSLRRSTRNKLSEHRT